jgi:hypothetical protein
MFRFFALSSFAVTLHSWTCFGLLAEVV